MLGEPTGNVLRTPSDDSILAQSQPIRVENRNAFRIDCALRTTVENSDFNSTCSKLLELDPSDQEFAGPLASMKIDDAPVPDIGSGQGMPKTVRVKADWRSKAQDHEWAVVHDSEVVRKVAHRRWCTGESQIQRR